MGPQRQSRIGNGMTGMLSADTPCDIAFRTIAAEHLKEFRSHSGSAKRGGAEAVHRMRVSLTRLKTAIRFFGPVLDRRWMARCDHALILPRKLLGSARDADIAIHDGHPSGEERRLWQKVRQRKYGALRQFLASKTCRELPKIFEPKVANNTARAKTASVSLSIFMPERLDIWTRKLVRNARHLKPLGTNKLHRVRIKSKRLRYALEWSLPTTPAKELRSRKKALKNAKLIHDELGHLCDASAHRDYASHEGLPPLSGFEEMDSKKARKHALTKVSYALERLKTSKREH